MQFALPRTLWPELFSGGFLKRIPVLIPHYWTGVLEGANVMSMGGVYEADPLRWRFFTAPAHFGENDLSLVSDRTMRRLLRHPRPGRDVGTVEWLQLQAPDARISVASMPGLKGSEVVMFGDHEEAPLRMHSHLEKLDISLRRPTVARSTIVAGATVMLLAAFIAGHTHGHHTKLRQITHAFAVGMQPPSDAVYW